MSSDRGMHIGLTGGIGSGKSTVAKLWCELGAVLVDTDAIARELTLPGGLAIAPIRQAFGDTFINGDGALDRSRMRALAFAEPASRRRLEAILHPLIGAETQRRARAASDAVVVFDVPLLAESAHWRGRVDKVLVVDCLEQTQADRVVERSGWARADVEAVIAQQASRKQRRACADAIIVNDGVSIGELRTLVRTLGRHWGIVLPADGPVEQ